MNIYAYLDVTEHVGKHRRVVHLPQPPEAEGQNIRQKNDGVFKKHSSVCCQRVMGVVYLFKPESIELFRNSPRGRIIAFLNKITKIAYFFWYKELLEWDEIISAPS